MISVKIDLIPQETNSVENTNMRFEESMDMWNVASTSSDILHNLIESEDIKQPQLCTSMMLLNVF